MSRVYLGRPGHFCAANRCRYHVHTHVNGFCVSTVGEYYPPIPGFLEPDAKPEEIGLGRLYETMVFRLVRGDEIDDWIELDFAAYNTAADADAGHEAMVRKYEAL